MIGKLWLTLHQVSANNKSVARIASQSSVVMIWYLLYPFRGTTDPPLLGPSHPLRRFFTQYGLEAARHPVITLLISVAIAAILIYPFPFLYTNDFTNGSSNLPHHVWTAAQPFEGDINTSPDVIMRSVWVHGSYMRALDIDILQAALEVQDELLGPTVNFNPKQANRGGAKMADLSGPLSLDVRDSLHAINGLNNQSWFFNSPLLYWSCSSEVVAQDSDIIATINKGLRQATSVNVTLRHSIVFSGKRFEDHRLVAADALVITLVHEIDSPVAREWERNSENLARKATGKWRIYPEDGRVISSRLYDFRFQPLSFQDDLVLGIAYSLAVAYFLLSLTRLRALKSRFGLSAAVITQIALSIMSSFTICAILKIDLSKIPRETYPLVVLSVGLENMFRLINALIVTPSESPTAFRIAEALGQTGHVALAGVAQNLVVLWLLYKVVSPGVAAFCVFAAIAIVFDFLYLLTFFIAVLSVEVRRTELGDSLKRSGQRSRSGGPGRSAPKKNWVDALLRGDLPLSTRISGTIVMIGFVLIAQWHFFDSETPVKTLSRIIQLIWADHKLPSSPPTVLSININQARTPTAWLRLQDHETAREVINVIKPNAHNFVARVYDPLILVHKGSDRTPSYKGIRPFLPAAYDFVKHQSTRFIMIVLFIVAAVSLLMNYLLWGEEDRGYGDIDDHTEEEQFLSVKTLSRGHALDIVILAASRNGVIVSVGLDRRIRVWDSRQDISARLVETRTRDTDVFPVLSIAIDDDANWLALVSATGQILLWHITARRWGPATNVDVNGRHPLMFSFTGTKNENFPWIILVRSNGIMASIILNPDGLLEISDRRLYAGALVSASQCLETTSAMIPQPCIVSVSRKGSIYISEQLKEGWASEKINMNSHEADDSVLYIYQIPMFRSFLAVRQNAIDLVDVGTRTIIHTFTSVRPNPTSVQCIYSVRRTNQYRSNSLVSFSVVYTERESGDCVLHTYSPRRQDEVLCMNIKNCPEGLVYCSWNEAMVQVYRTEAPGKWQTLPIGVVIGVRKRPSPVTITNGNGSLGFSFPNSQIRRRSRTFFRTTRPPITENEDIWETWMLSAKGERATVTLGSDEDGALLNGHLLVSSCGPMIRSGQRSVVVGMGNVIKVITVSSDRFNEEERSDDMVKAISGRRRRPATGKKRSNGHNI